MAFGIQQQLQQEAGLHPIAARMLDWTEKFVPKPISLLVTEIS